MNLQVDPSGGGQMPIAPGCMWKLGRHQIDCSVPRIMAVANVTPDSFYDDSQLPFDPPSLRTRLAAIIGQQPDLLDIGGQSTRPGSPRVPPEEELRRVIPALRLARELAPELPITVDTYSAMVAREVLAAGADGINDISGGELDPELLKVIAQHRGCGYVLMHMQGTPETMQANPTYVDAVTEIKAFLGRQLGNLVAAGVDSERIVLDPGIGFGKRLEDNVALIRRAGELLELGRPVVYGVSRKSFIGKLDASARTPKDRLPGTLAATWELLRQGVTIHRVHDVAEVRQVMRVWQGIGGG